ncbi:MAG: acyl carrier protein [Lachnospiraceae bacterium]|nr:acyl carrier protein [Lachnospiraceae bacterium]
MEDYLDVVKQILLDLHPELDGDEDRDGLVADGILDSYDIITIITQLADEFDAVITADKITPENFDSAESIAELVDEILNE